MSDLRSLSQQLLLLQPQPLLLHLLQPQLVAASQDAAVAAGALLDRGALGHPLLVHGCERRKTRQTPVRTFAGVERTEKVHCFFFFKKQ